MCIRDSALRDYEEFDLPCRMQTPQGQALLRVVDPYAYRDRYTCLLYTSLCCCARNIFGLWRWF